MSDAERMQEILKKLEAPKYIIDGCVSGTLAHPPLLIALEIIVERLCKLENDKR